MRPPLTTVAARCGDGAVQSVRRTVRACPDAVTFAFGSETGQWRTAAGGGRLARGISTLTGTDPGSAVGDESAARFAAQLRQLRERAGSPSFRQMARITHYSSSTLAEATAGKRLPTEPVVKAFVTACGEDPADWIASLRNAESALRLADAPPPAAAHPEPQEQTLHVRRLHRRVAAAAGALGLLAVGAIAGALLRTGVSSPGPVQSLLADVPFSAVPSTVPSGDGEDPTAAGCAPDARLVDKTALMRGTTQIGALELKYSPRCHTGWARVYLYPNQQSMIARVDVRTADGRASLIAEAMIKQMPVYTDALNPGPGGCLSADAEAFSPGTPPISATIPCDAMPN